MLKINPKIESVVVPRLCHVTIQGSNMVAAVDNWSCYIESDKLVSSKQQDCRGVEEASVATIHQTPDNSY